MSSKDCQFCGKSILKENIKEHLKSDCKYVQIETSGNIDLSSFRNGHCIKNSVVKCRLCEEVIKINHKTHVNQCKNFYKFASFQFQQKSWRGFNKRYKWYYDMLDRRSLIEMGLKTLRIQRAKWDKISSKDLFIRIIIQLLDNRKSNIFGFRLLHMYLPPRFLDLPYDPAETVQETSLSTCHVSSA